MPGKLIISLDFELMWGMRDRQTSAAYGDAVMGGRAAIPQILDRFTRHGIRATWATVGFLFAENRDHVMAAMPERRPAYHDPTLDPYRYVFDGLGQDERDDPLHFGRSLVDRIADTPGQEIASHTFSHFTCLEMGSTLAAFEADLAAAVAIAEDAGHVMQSLVFPRNQMTDLHMAVAARQGLVTVRAAPRAPLYRPRPRAAETTTLRALRLADGALPLVQTVAPQPTNGRVPASRFLRPITRIPGYGAAHLLRIEREMERAARMGGIYHLWWHPHNFGRATEANLAQLDAILAIFTRMRHCHGMVSATMADVSGAIVRPPTLVKATSK